jgi:hypothetical protein
MEGLARVIAGLPPPEASAAALQLGTPVLERLQQLMPQLSGATASHRLSASLLDSTCVRLA